MAAPPLREPAELRRRWRDALIRARDSRSTNTQTRLGNLQSAYAGQIAQTGEVAGISREGYRMLIRAAVFEVFPTRGEEVFRVISALDVPPPRAPPPPPIAVPPPPPPPPVARAFDWDAAFEGIRP